MNVNNLNKRLDKAATDLVLIKAELLQMARDSKNIYLQSDLSLAHKSITDARFVIQIVRQRYALQQETPSDD
jgi:hypothetical protein